MIKCCAPDEVARLLPRALTGEFVLAPVGDEKTAALLAADQPVTEPDAAVIVATSGSTGRPKFVVLTAAAIAAAAQAFRQRYGSFSWTCVLPTQHVAGLMVLARDLLDQPHPYTGRRAISLVPTQLVRALRDEASTAELAGFQAVLVGGAALPAGLAETARTRGINVLTSYGMSETCGGVAFDGYPLPGIDIDIAADGRISIGGPTVFAGYRGDPRASAKTLVAGRVRTSDRGEWTTGPAGQPRLRVLGRIDEAVISGGVNVDLAQLQRVLDELADTDAVVTAVPDPEWGSRIVLVTTEQTELAHWRTKLCPHLEPAALPRQLLVVAELPRTPAGKVDQQLLQAWAQSVTTRTEN